MRKIYTIGESLLDIIFENNIPLAAKPGGSLLNTSVSLAKAGNQIFLISELGDDHAGKLILESLKNNGIDVSNIRLYKDNQTALALAFLDDNKNASYSFYKNYNTSRNLIQPKIIEDDILIFGSIYGITKEIRTSLLKIVQTARQNNALIIYDPNIRKNAGIKDSFSLIIENISHSDIVKASDEDLYNIFGNISNEEVYRKIREYGCTNLIITQNKSNVLLLTSGFREEYNIPEIQVVSTIGAGDAFNAGIVHGIIKYKQNKAHINDMSLGLWKKIIETGIAFASDVCMSYENSISNMLIQKLN